MKNKKFKTLAVVIAFSLLLAGCKDPAYFDHKVSRLTQGWKFDPVVMKKIHRSLARGEVAVGLSRLEQKMLDQYGIGFGTAFFTQIKNEVWKMTRTSTGLRFDKSARLWAGAKLRSFPITPARFKVLPVAYRVAGRGKKAPDITWKFDKALQDKIQMRIILKGVPSAIGLSRFQQKILQRYGIQVGQSFQTTMAGRVLTIKRVSLGLRIQGIAKKKATSYFTS